MSEFGPEVDWQVSGGKGPKAAIRQWAQILKMRFGDRQHPLGGKLLCSPTESLCFSGAVLQNGGEDLLLAAAPPTCQRDAVTFAVTPVTDPVFCTLSVIV